jgi:ceramide glucosyltransferase
MAAVAFALLALVGLVWIALGAHVMAAVRSERAEEIARAPVTILKPLAGLDDGLEELLTSFFAQDHSGMLPRLQLVFGAREGDPALALARRIAARHPHVDTAFVEHDGGRGLNPKVDNLRAMITAARYDTVIISDANTLAHPSYAREMVARLAGHRVGLVTSFVCGTGEETLGATLDALALNGEIATACAVGTGLGIHPMVVGKSMAFRRSTFERLGGFESIASVLAEDYVVGRMFHAAGYRVALAPVPIRSINRRGTVGAFARRHLRWTMMRARLSPIAFALEPLTRPLIVALLAPLFGVAFAPALALGVVATLGRDAFGWLVMRGRAGLGRALLLSLPRELFAMALWAIAPFRRHVTWRGNRVRVSAGTRLYAEHLPEAPSELGISR